MVKIIDNHKIDMTEDEWNIYIEICRSYDRPNFKGEELFKGLFETDDNGLIVFLKPPGNRHTSMEVFLFMSALMLHQHLRVMHKRVDSLIDNTKEKVESLIKSQTEAKAEIDKK